MDYGQFERIQEKYVRWVLGLDRQTPGYIVRDEGKRKKLREETGKRAVEFEERNNERKECKIIQGVPELARQPLPVDSRFHSKSDSAIKIAQNLLI